MSQSLHEIAERIIEVPKVEAEPKDMTSELDLELMSIISGAGCTTHCLRRLMEG